MTAIQRILDEAAVRAAEHGPKSAYDYLLGSALEDVDGLINLALARLALTVRQPDRALRHLDLSRKAAPHSADVLFEYGRAFNNTRSYERAAVAFRDALALRPRWLDAHLNLAHVLRASGAFRLALEAYEQALRLDGDSARGHAGIATVYLELADTPAALRHFERACELQPDSVALWSQRGQALQSAGLPEEAVTCFTRAVQYAAQDPSLRSALGSAWQSCGELERARASFAEALLIAPDYAPARAALAGVRDVQGFHDEALGLLSASVARPDAAPVLLVAYANLKANRELGATTLGRLEAATDNPATEPVMRALLHYRIGDAYDQLDQPSIAFDHYASANSLRGVAYDHKSLARHTDTIVARMRAGGRSVVTTGVRPIFIVGLPRSGTSLLEQILSRHSAIAAAGEQRALALIANEALTGGNGDDAHALSSIAQRYRQTLGEHAKQKPLCTDKMWQNFEWLWLIRRALPDAHIIHCQRHPLAVGLSCFQRSFGAAPPPFATRLEDIAAYISHHEEIMAAWREVGSPATVTVRYEDLVADLEGQVRRLLDNLGLPFDAACLTFFEAKRAVTTASFDQVDRPIFTDSLERWRRYERQLEPLVDALRRRGHGPGTWPQHDPV